MSVLRYRSPFRWMSTAIGRCDLSETRLLIGPPPAAFSGFSALFSGFTAVLAGALCCDWKAGGSGGDLLMVAGGSEAGDAADNEPDELDGEEWSVAARRGIDDAGGFDGAAVTNGSGSNWARSDAIAADDAELKTFETDAAAAAAAIFIDRASGRSCLAALASPGWNAASPGGKKRRGFGKRCCGDSGGCSYGGC